MRTAAVEADTQPSRKNAYPARNRRPGRARLAE